MWIYSFQETASSGYLKNCSLGLIFLPQMLPLDANLLHVWNMSSNWTPKCRPREQLDLHGACSSLCMKSRPCSCFIFNKCNNLTVP